MSTTLDLTGSWADPDIKIGATLSASALSTTIEFSFKAGPLQCKIAEKEFTFGEELEPIDLFDPNPKVLHTFED